MGFLSWEGSQSLSVPIDSLVMTMGDSMVIGGIMRSRKAEILEYKYEICSLIVCALYHHVCLVAILPISPMIKT